MPCGKFASNHQKHYPDLGSDTSSVWNFCTHFSDVISQGNHWGGHEMSSFFSGYFFRQETLLHCLSSPRVKFSRFYYSVITTVWSHLFFALIHSYCLKLQSGKVCLWWQHPWQKVKIYFITVCWDLITSQLFWIVHTTVIPSLWAGHRISLMLRVGSCTEFHSAWQALNRVFKHCHCTVLTVLYPNNFFF